MNSKKLPWWLWGGVAITAAVSLYSLGLRHRVESRNRAVSIAVEMEAVQALAASAGWTVEEVLRELRGNGVRAVVLTEETVAQLSNEASVTANPQTAFASHGPRIARGVSIRFPGSRFGSLPNGLERTVSVGIDPNEAAAARATDLTIIARFGNPLGATKEYVQKTLGWGRELGASVFLPMGEQVLGRREALGQTEASLNELGLLYATPEFGKISGDAQLVAALPERVLRLHAAQGAELDKLTKADAVERYAKAARERNMRVLLVRPLTQGSERPVQSFGSFIASINSELQKDRLQVGIAHPFEDPNVPGWVPTGIGLGTLVVVAGFLRSLTSSTRPFWIGLLFAAALLLRPGGAGQAALLAAILFPLVAIVFIDRGVNLPVAIVFVGACGIALVGGLAVAGLLNGLPYLVKADGFSGIKLAVFAPVAFALVYYLTRAVNLRELVASPLTIGWVLLGLCIVGAMGLLILRSGNEPASGVSSLELQFRNLLDRFLPVRPRTKEFLIGHPALILGIGMLPLSRLSAAQSRTTGLISALLLTIGAMGLTSIVNTFCHLHTPVLLSLMRVVTGMVIGAVIGGALWWILSPAQRGRET